VKVYLPEPEFDVVFVGSGVAGALAAYRLAQARYRVLMLEAGGVVPDSIGRLAMVNNFMTSPSKSPDSPFCGDNILAVQPNPVGDGKNYYDYDPTKKSDVFKSFYERVVGGSTWHWQGIYIRMLPNDFKTRSLYGVGFDWPITYDDLEPWYVEAEYEMGVAGNDKQIDEFFKPRFGAYRSRPFPMPELVPSYLDAQISNAIGGKSFDGLPLRVTNVPHAINSQPYDGRPACDGHTSCVPLCPIKARYEAITHVEKAVRAGALLRTQAVVTHLELDPQRKRVVRVWYRHGDEEPEWVSGRIVVLAANGIENPRILLSSNAANSSDAVGRYLMDHPIKQSFALATRPLYPFRGPQTTSDIETFRDGTFRRSFAAFKTSIKNDGWATTPTGAPRGNLMPAQKGASERSPGTILDLVHNWNYFGTKLRDKMIDHAIRQVTLNSASEQLPLRENRITLSANKDPSGIPRPLIQYLVDDPRGYVRGSFRKIIQMHSFVFDQMGIPPGDRTMQADPDNQPLQYGGSGHIMGTTLMGKDPKTSVVDKDCRAHDHHNLFILGSSAFPTSSTANPTSTIAALSLRAADTIKRQLRQG
jgi:choline dehydrogenase-like flavoprotein